MPTSPFTNWIFDHAALRVPDFEAAVAWYTQKLDFHLTKSAQLGDKTYGWLTSPTTLTIELVAGPGAADRPPYTDLGSSLKLSGLHHLGFQVSSVDATIAELTRRGVSFLSEPHDVPAIGLRVAFFADPWHNLFEVTEPLAKS